MTNKITLKVITEKRSDAIYICNKSLIQNLQKKDADIKVIFLNNRLLQSSLFNFILGVVNTIRIISMINRNDIVLFTDPLSFNLLASILIPNKKYVIFYHYEKDPFYYKYLPFISYKKVLDKFNGIICISNFALSQLDSLGVNIKKCRAIYYGIDHSLFKPSTSKTYPYDYILSVGSEEPRKNMENVLKTFQILIKDYPNLKLLKVGEANGHNRKKTMHYIEELQLTKSVIFTDYVKEEELPQIYSGAKLLLFPSLLEGFGLPIVEAMACGCPVITSDRNPMKELVGTEQYTVNPLDPNDIAAECKKILLDDVYRQTLIDNGLLRAKGFNWEKTANEVYEYMTKQM